MTLQERKIKIANSTKSGKMTVQRKEMLNNHEYIRGNNGKFTFHAISFYDDIRKLMFIRSLKDSQARITDVTAANVFRELQNRISPRISNNGHVEN